MTCTSFIIDIYVIFGALMSVVLSMLDRIASWRGISVLIVLYAIIFGGIVATLSQLTELSGGTGILDFDRGYSVDRVREVFDSYGENGLVLYRRIQLLDLFNPAIYALLFASIIYWLWKRRATVWVVLLPLAAGLLDYCENLTLLLLSRSYPVLSPQLVAISSTLSLVKNVALFGTIGVLLIGLLLWARARFAQNANGP